MTLTNKTIMAPINSIYDDDIEERIERRTRIVQDAYSKAKEAEAEQEASIIRRINTLEYDATCTRARVNELEKKNEELVLTNETIMKELEIKNPIFQKELQQKVSKMIRNLKQ